MSRSSVTHVSLLKATNSRRPQSGSTAGQGAGSRERLPTSSFSQLRLSSVCMSCLVIRWLKASTSSSPDGEGPSRDGGRPSSAGPAVGGGGQRRVPTGRTESGGPVPLQTAMPSVREALNLLLGLPASSGWDSWELATTICPSCPHGERERNRT